MGNSNALGTSFAFPFGPSGAAEYPPALDHDTIGRARLLEQFRHRPKLNAMASALLAGVQDVEDALHDLWTDRLLDTAAGLQVDVLGEHRQVEREGRTDAAYLQMIQTLALAHRSSGTVPEIYALLERLAPGGSFRIDQLIEDVAGFGVRLTSPVLIDPPASPDDLTPEIVERVLRRARAGGVRIWFSWWPDVEANLFTLCDGNDPIAGAALGMSDDAMTTGGKLIGEVIA
jgi:hypothetical protein